MPPRAKKPMQLRKPGRTTRPLSFRVGFARVKLASGMRVTEVEAAIRAHFGVSKATAERDRREAEYLNNEILDRTLPDQIKRNIAKLDVIADDAHAASKYNDAVAAVKEINRVIGAHAPRKIQVTGQLNVAIDAHAIVGVLDERGLAALELVMTQIEAAKARGELAEPAPEPDAEQAADPSGDDSDED